MSVVDQVSLGRSFGVMQGRLSPQSPRGYQTFPSQTWAQEFEIASKMGFEHIEWVVETFDIHHNPLIENPESIREQIEIHGVRVISACADFLMDSPLDSENTDSWKLLNRLLRNAQDLDIEVVVIPCVDSSSLLDTRNLRRLEQSLSQIIDTAERRNVVLALETDLPPQEFGELLAKFDTPFLSVNYDSGNSASLGYSFEEEMGTYGHRISDFHLKDRVLGGTSVALGAGSVNFSQVFSYLSPLSFGGIVTMQAMRDNLGVPATEQQLEWIQEQLDPEKRETQENA